MMTWKEILVRLQTHIIENMLLKDLSDYSEAYNQALNDVIDVIQTAIFGQYDENIPDISL